MHHGPRQYLASQTRSILCSQYDFVCDREHILLEVSAGRGLLLYSIPSWLIPPGQRMRRSHSNQVALVIREHSLYRRKCHLWMSRFCENEYDMQRNKHTESVNVHGSITLIANVSFILYFLTSRTGFPVRIRQIPIIDMSRNSCSGA